MIKPYALINKKKKFILFTNPKCAGTTMKSWFLHSLELHDTFTNLITGIRNYGFFFLFKWYKVRPFLHNSDKILYDNDVLRDFIRKYRSSTLKSTTKHLFDKSYYKFVVTRNPYDRLVSVFVDKFCGEDVNSSWVQKVIRKVNSIDEKGRLKISFSEFVDYLETVDIDRVNRHWRRQSYIIDYIELDQIIDLKMLKTKIPEIEKSLNIIGGFSFEKKRQSNQYDNLDKSFVGDQSNLDLIDRLKTKDIFPSKEAFFNDEIKNKIYNIYQKDFELLNYQK